MKISSVWRASKKQLRWSAQYRRRPTARPVRCFEMLEGRMLLSATMPRADFSLVAVDEPDVALVHKAIVAGNPNGSPVDSPANRVDPNTISSDFGGVGSLFMDLGNGTGFLCTGTLISPRHVLTAGHCVDVDDNGSADFAPQDVSFFLNYGSNFSHTFTASALYVHPDFSGFANPSVLDDLTVVELSSSVPAGVPIYEINTAPFVNIETTTLVGYGTTGDGVNGYISGSASFTVKRTGMNHADVFLSDDEGTGTREGFEWDFDGAGKNTNVFGTPQAFNLTLGNDVETTVGGGDSGGPSFIDDGNGGLLLFGVNTFTASQKAPAPLFGSVGGGIVVSTYADWIDSITATVPATVVGRHIFYNDSSFDGNNPAQGVADDNAVPTKTAYLPGDGLAVYNNVSNFTKGITGIMVDLDGGGDHASITAADFTFKHGNNNTPGSWAAVAATPTVGVRLGDGDGGADRVTITWGTDDIKNEWLEVQVLATANTGLASADVHYWGNRTADSGESTPATQFSTTTSDSSTIFGHLTGSASVDNDYDYNRSGAVTTGDSSLVFGSLGNITRIDIPGPAPAPASAGDGTSAVASALAASSSSGGRADSGWIEAALANAAIDSGPAAASSEMIEGDTLRSRPLPGGFNTNTGLAWTTDTSSGPITSLFQPLQEADRPRSLTHLEATDEVVESLDVDDALLDRLLATLLA